MKLKNLTGYTTYMISVAAFNAAGDGPRSLPTRGRTQQAGGLQSIQMSLTMCESDVQTTSGIGLEIRQCSISH